MMRLMAMTGGALPLMTLIMQCFIVDSSNGLSKYSEEANLDIKELMTQIKPFRIQKVNMLWAAGRKQKDLSEERRIDLFKELQSHEILEIRLKKMRAENLDEDGLMEAKVLRSFRRITDKYSLDDVTSKSGTENKGKQKKEDADEESVSLQDSKLKEMWKEALHSGFSDEDLALLQEEFAHQQMKISEFNLVHGELNDLNDADENSIFVDGDAEGQFSDDGKERGTAKRRGKQDIQDGFRKLEHLTATLSPLDGEFEDARVNSLWNMAQKSKWPKQKLNSFRDELKHFERRLSKQKHYADQLKMSLQALEHKRSPGNHKFLEEKADALNREVKKYHTDLKERIAKAIRHSEL